MYKKEKVQKMYRICIFIITFFIASTINNVLSSLPLRNTIDNNNKYKIELYDQQYSSIKDQLRKKNRANAKAEAIVMEWYVILSVGLSIFGFKFQK